MIQDFLFSSRKSSCIRSISLQVYNKCCYLSLERIGDAHLDFRCIMTWKGKSTHIMDTNERTDLNIFLLIVEKSQLTYGAFVQPPHIINYEISSYCVWYFQSLQFDANLQGRIQDFLKWGGGRHMCKGVGFQIWGN